MENKTKIDQLYECLNNDLLYENYSELTENTGDLTEGLALQYVSLAETIRDRELLFVKRLTKVASHRLKNHPDSILEKLFSFNIDGAEMCGLRDYSEEGIPEDNCMVIKGHFFSHAGTDAYHIYQRQDHDLGWAQRSYDANSRASSSLADLRPLESARTSFFAAEMARKLYYATNNSIWLKKAKRGYISALNGDVAGSGGLEDDLIERANNALRYIGKKRQGNRGNGGRSGRYNRRRRVDKRKRKINLD